MRLSRSSKVRLWLRCYVPPSQRKVAMSEQAKQKPERVFRRGALSVSVWKRERQTDTGVETYYNATPQRAFTRDDGKTWEYSDSFGTDDLPTVAALLQAAFYWIVGQGK